jgi:hypothetical protein
MRAVEVQKKYTTSTGYDELREIPNHAPFAQSTKSAAPGCLVGLQELASVNRGSSAAVWCDIDTLPRNQCEWAWKSSVSKAASGAAAVM